MSGSWLMVLGGTIVTATLFHQSIMKRQFIRRVERGRCVRHPPTIHPFKSASNYQVVIFHYATLTRPSRHVNRLRGQQYVEERKRRKSDWQEKVTRWTLIALHAPIWLIHNMQTTPHYEAIYASDRDYINDGMPPSTPGYFDPPPY